MRGDERRYEEATDLVSLTPSLGVLFSHAGERHEIVIHKSEEEPTAQSFSKLNCRFLDAWFPTPNTWLDC